MVVPSKIMRLVGFVIVASLHHCGASGGSCLPGSCTSKADESKAQTKKEVAPTTKPVHDGLASAIALVRKGDRSAARALLAKTKGTSDASALFLRAYLESDVGDSLIAFQLLQELEPTDYPERIRSLIYVSMMASSQSNDDCTGFRQAFDKLHQNQLKASVNDYLMLVACTEQDANARYAAAKLHPNVEKEVEGLLFIAEQALELNKKEEAKAAYKKAALGFPSSDSTIASAAQNAGVTYALDDADRIRRARLLYRQRRYKRVLKELDAVKVRGLRPNYKAKYLHFLGMAQYRLKQYDIAAKTLIRAKKLPSSFRIDDMLHAARANSRAGNTKAAMRGYRDIVDNFTKDAAADKAASLLAWNLLRLPNGSRAAGYREAKKLFADRFKLIGQESAARPSTNRALKAIGWELALHDIRHGRYPRAISTLKRIITMHADTGMERGKILYWLGRAFQIRGRRDDAMKYFERALYVEPLHWYAQLAAARITELGRDQPNPFAADALTAHVPAAATTTSEGVKLPDSAAFLLALGLNKEATAEVKHTHSVDSVPYALRLRQLAAVEAYVSAFRLAASRRRALSKPVDSENALIWTSAYPTPYFEWVNAHANKQAVPPAYVFATMRQESAFFSRARSGAGALGLLQLMPTTAEKLYRTDDEQASKSPFVPSMLFDPEINISLGVREMKRSLARYGGNIPLALAGYNAGHHRVRSWLSRFDQAPLDLFVEEVPFTETRNYMRRVTSHLARYSYLLNPEKPWPSLQLGPVSREQIGQK